MSATAESEIEVNSIPDLAAVEAVSSHLARLRALSFGVPVLQVSHVEQHDC